MKVLFVASGNSPQGISPIIRNQGESLQKAGLTIGFFAITGKGFKGYLKSILELRKYLSAHKYDIIHAHYGLSAIVALFAKRKGKLIVSFMGDDLVGSNRSDGSVTFSSKLGVLLNILQAKTFYSFCIIKSGEMNDILRLNHKALIPNGVDLEKFHFISKEKARSLTGVNLNDKLVIFISDTKRTEKNYKLAEESVALLSDFKVKFLPLTGVDHSVLINYYNTADVLILTSFHEGSPNVIKEAMACNCPIVSTNVGEVKWLMGNIAGCHISSFDPVEFAEKIKLAIAFRGKHGQTNGRERIIELGLDSETVAGKIINVYKKVLTIDD